MTFSFLLSNFTLIKLRVRKKEETNVEKIELEMESVKLLVHYLFVQSVKLLIELNNIINI